MKKIYFVILLFALPFCVNAQFVVNRSGNWTDVNPPTTPWQGGVPASTVNDDVTMQDTYNITVAGSDNITSGNLTTGNTNTLTVQPGGILQLGDAGNIRNLIAGTSMTITVQNNGTIIIWGDLMVNSSLIAGIQGPNGKIIIKGNVNLADNATLTVNGDLEVDGNFTGGLSTGVNLGPGGTVSVGGTLAVGAGSYFHASCSSGSAPTGTNCGNFHAHQCAGDPDSQAFCTNAGLPVELLFFRAEAAQTAVNLKWATGSELNFDYFLIEKSTDGKNFTEFTTVQGAGTSRQQIDYSIADARPSLGRSYYRLTEVDLDRSVHPLKIVAVDFTGARSISIFPNPSTGGQINFELNFVPENNVVVSIVDLRGTTLSEFVIDKQSTALPLQLTAGVYVVTMRTEGFKSVSKLIVR